MTAAIDTTTPDGDLSLSIERVFDAPIELVYAAWAEKKHLAQWSCPQDMTLSAVEFDGHSVTAGTPYRLCMTATDGDSFWLSGTYQEVVPGQRLVYTAAWEDAAGNRGHETLITLTFEALGDKTKLVMHQARFETASSRDSHHEGWTSTLESLAANLSENIQRRWD